jgi:serine/threonine protein kinase
MYALPQLMRGVNELHCRSMFHLGSTHRGTREYPVSTNEYPCEYYALPQLMRGVNELHCRSMFHLDIKIENVMVAKDPATGSEHVYLMYIHALYTYLCNHL